MRIGAVLLSVPHQFAFSGWSLGDEAHGKTRVIVVVAVLLLILAAELLLSVRRESQTFDESAHLFAGYSYWKSGDFGVNPEHPPLVKLVAALPLLPLGLPIFPAPPIYFRAASTAGGNRLLYSNDADALLFRSRVAVSIFTLALAVLVFFAGKEMYGLNAAVFALALYIFEPNVLGNGALVTTDMGASCLVFGAVYCFYRYCKRPSISRLVVAALVVGLALAAKHSTVLLIPIFLVLAATEIAWPRNLEVGSRETHGKQVLRLVGGLAVIAVVSVTILWAFYGFRYKARPDDLQIIPPTAAALQGLKDYPTEAKVIGGMERLHLLPEAYLYGLTDVATLTHSGRAMFLLGRDYPAGRWFYFPVVFVIKSTLGFLLLLALIFVSRKIWSLEYRREFLFLVVPAVIWLAIAMTSKLDMGLRHVLPIYPFLLVLVGGAAIMLVRRSKRWAYVVGILLAFHIFSSLRAFPDYLPYSNEIWGGPSNTYKVLADANVGWEGGLTSLQRYLNDRHITHCWFAFDGPNDPGYYHIPCAPLPTFFSFLAHRGQDIVPGEIQGPVFLGSNARTAFDWGPQEMNPYDQFVGLAPSAVLHGEILMYDGRFLVPKVAALSHFVAAVRLSERGRSDEALLEAQTAAQLDPNFIQTHEMLAALYAQKHQPAEATREYQAAMHLYQTMHPEFQKLNDPPENPLKQQ